MHRCYIHPDKWQERLLNPDIEESHYILDVLRAKNGDRIAVFDGRGREAVAEVKRVENGIPCLEPVSCESFVPFGMSFVLIQALPKGKRMDLIVEKSVELGAASIWPVITSRTVSRPEGEKRIRRSERWQKIALNAARQCGAEWVPDILPVCDYCDAVDRTAELDFLIVGSLSENAGSLRSVIGGIRKMTELEAPDKTFRTGLLIGPEGDLERSELDSAVEAGGIEASFGSLVLRVETAAIYALSVLGYEFREIREESLGAAGCSR